MLGSGKIAHLREGLGKKNGIFSIDFKMATFPLTLPGAQDLFPILLYENLIVLLKVKLTNVWDLSKTGP